VTGLLVVLTATQATAQEVDPADSARFRFGIFRFTPSISLKNLGVDTNVFNEFENPKRDNTAAFGPQMDFWMHLGRSRVIGIATAEYLYFKQYDDQRAWNTTDSMRWEVPLARITPYVSGTYANTKSRPGFEIDARARQQNQGVELGSEVRLSGKTSVRLSGEQTRLTYDPDETFSGVDLATALNRRTNVENLELRYKLTTLTTFVLTGEALQDRFLGDDLRNSNSVRALTGFEMKPGALVSGGVAVGVRKFAPLRPTVQPYQGIVAKVDAKYAVRATKFDLKVNRDIEFSYQPAQPYYTLTDTRLDITQRITYTWDVVVRGGRQLLDYKRVVSPLDQVSLPATRDRVQQYGGGIGYRVGRTMRLGLDGVYFRRLSSDIETRDYKGARFGASFSYGIPQ
jgi:hypothetical protein